VNRGEYRFSVVSSFQTDRKHLTRFARQGAGITVASSAFALNSSASGIFETCRRTLNFSAYRGRPDVVGALSQLRE
jgi:hypothetical protein